MTEAGERPPSPPRNPRPPPNKKNRRQIPQRNIDDFWAAFTSKFPGKIHTILPQCGRAKQKAAREPKGTVYGQAALKSYDQARAECEAAVQKISKECRRVNMRYRDAHFDMEFDLKWCIRDCLEGLLLLRDTSFNPKSVKRVHEIFEDPHFYIDDATASDIRQGFDGDCWFLSALSACTNKQDWIKRICVARDEQVGVYGFVFHRDGEWFHIVVDDKLYLVSADYDESTHEKATWNQLLNRQDAEEEYRKAYQTGSRALYFAQCTHENETWLPLIEKAFAKARGDYRAISGGFTGEGIEDLTGGVTTELFTSDILDIGKFWTDELLKVNDEFLFSCATGWSDDFLGGGSMTNRKGVIAMHAYSIMEAREVQGQRLLKLRNPWGQAEWQGPWSDGSAEWTPEWMQLLNHRFGNDGIFWISYKDLLRKYQSFDRTRLFGPEWTITQQWTTVDVPWTADFNDTKFEITVSKPGPVVIALSQLDDRYWRDLEGQYTFKLHFRLEKEGEAGYIVRSHGNYLMSRSVSTDLELESGTYSVLMKITARRWAMQPTPEQVVREVCHRKRDKLLQIGLAYDLAHAKGWIRETEEEKARDAERMAKAKAAAKQKAKQELRNEQYKEWVKCKKHQERHRRDRRRHEKRSREKAEAKKAATKEAKQALRPFPSVVMEAEIVSQVKRTHKAEQCKDAEVKGDEETVHSTEKLADNDAAVINGTPTRPENHMTAAPGGTNEGAHNNGSTSADGKTPPTPPSEVPEAGRAEGEAQDGLSPIGGRKDSTAQDKIDEFNKDLQSISEVEVTDISNPHKSDDRPSAAHGSCLDPASAAGGDVSDSSSILSFISSVNTIADLDVFHHDDYDGRSSTQNSEDAIDSDNEAVANDPWNAVCVVGLRVFNKEGEVSIKVVRPRKEDEDEETPLDVDDPSKGVSDDPSLAREEAQNEGDGL